MIDSQQKQTFCREKVITTTCSCHCDGKCIVKLHVKDGVITKINADDATDPQLRPCLKGRAYRQRIYSPDRLLYPLRRIGARGQGKFERISWDEALDTIARELRRIKETYGPAAILLLMSAGDAGRLHTASLVNRLLCMMGGCTRTWGLPSNEGGSFASLVTYGDMRCRSTHDDLLNSRLIILWGCDPANTGIGNLCWYLAQAREKGIRIISIDPRYTNTTAVFTNQWIPIIPNTDTALLIAMAYVIVERNLHNRAFIDSYTIGFDQFNEYVSGIEDGVTKTPAWAESITGVPAATIENLAIEFATTKPAAIVCGIAPGRTAFGEQYHRAAITLSAITGNIGIHGGSSAGMVEAFTFGAYPFVMIPRVGRGLADVANLVDNAAPSRKYALTSYGENALSTKIHFAKVADAILEGKNGGYPSDYKLLYIVDASYPNQHANINKAVKALNKLEFIVVHEQFMTPSAKFADIVLPSSSLYEKNDVTSGNVTPPFFGYMHKVVEPLGESKSHLEITTELADRLSLSGFNDKTEDEWLRECVRSSDIPDYNAFKEKGYYKIELPEPYVAFKEQIEDPANHPFPTPSGKIEIYSQQLADMKQTKLPPIPKYVESWENRNDPLIKKYPLQLITTHIKRRAHTQFEDLPWLMEIQNQVILINSADAKVRKINDGDTVRVFNDRGETIILAKVTERIIPGVVDIPQGAWFNPDERGVDTGGSANVLTKDEPSPGGAFPYNTCLVQVKKVRI